MEVLVLLMGPGMVSLEGVLDVLENEPDGHRGAVDIVHDILTAFAFNPELSKERISAILVAFALAAHDTFIDAQDLMRQGVKDLPPPVVEVMLPEYNAGLSVLNFVRCWTDHDLAGTKFLEHASSQMYWHDAVELDNPEMVERGERDDMLVRAEALVRKMPHRYPIVEWKLKALKRKRGSA